MKGPPHSIAIARQDAAPGWHLRGSWAAPGQLLCALAWLWAVQIGLGAGLGRSWAGLRGGVVWSWGGPGNILGNFGVILGAILGPRVLWISLSKNSVNQLRPLGSF